MKAQSQQFTTYEYHSQVAELFAGMSNASNDLQSCLAHLQRLSELATVSASDTLISVALYLYKRAFTGRLGATLECEYVKLIGPSGLSLHKLILDAGEAHFNPRVSPDHAKIGVRVRNRQIVGISPVQASTDQWGIDVIQRWTELVTTILNRFIAPELTRLELQLHNEVRLLGIQLVSYLPVLEGQAVTSAQQEPQFCC